MNILGLFSPTGSLPVFHRREVGGTVGNLPAAETQGVPSSTMPPEPKVSGGSFEERIVFAASPYVALTVSPVYRAIKLIMNTMSVMPVQYRKKDFEKGNFYIDMRGLGKRINYLLQEEPNPIMTASEMWEQVTYAQLIRGNGFVYIERDEMDFPLHLWFVRMGEYNIFTGRYNFIQYLGENGYVTLNNVPREDVMLRSFFNICRPCMQNSRFFILRHRRRAKFRPRRSTALREC